jgi:hypothetical protein
MRKRTPPQVKNISYDFWTTMLLFFFLIPGISFSKEEIKKFLEDDRAKKCNHQDAEENTSGKNLFILFLNN